MNSLIRIAINRLTHQGKHKLAAAVNEQATKIDKLEAVYAVAKKLNDIDRDIAPWADIWDELYKVIVLVEVEDKPESKPPFGLGPEHYEGRN